ncbi:hypothetical protein BKA65DRAFT_580611 [Rhexocercosporidium sp. MPI-PUGE-AT-0058]|nr:hypothetical protein BKA65DRAFT_580611 [Rhexocercosporidium sp. MPI-PUGE-AT-0058]
MSHLRLKSFHLHHRAKSPKTKLLDLDTDITIMIFDVSKAAQSPRIPPTLHATRRQGYGKYLPATYMASLTNLVCRQEFSNLVSVTVEMDSAETNLQEFLASSHNLEFLSIRCLNGHRFSPSKGKIPAIKHLELKNYPWCHSLDETALIWDFSKLETLFLHSKRSHSNGAFLRSAATRPFPRLKKLNSRHPIPYSASAVVYDVFNPSPGLELRSFILSLPMLEDLTIHQFCPEILVPCIVKIGSNLRKLRMHVGKHQFLRDVELLDIQRSCPNLETLGLHRDPEKDQSGTAFLKALCGFEKVRWLKIEYRTFSQMSDAEGKKVYRYIKAKKSGSRLDRFEFVNHVNEFHWLRTHIRRFSPELSKWVS